MCFTKTATFPPLLYIIKEADWSGWSFFTSRKIRNFHQVNETFIIVILFFELFRIITISLKVSSFLEITDAYELWSERSKPARRWLWVKNEKLLKLRFEAISTINRFDYLSRKTCIRQRSAQSRKLGKLSSITRTDELFRACMAAVRGWVTRRRGSGRNGKNNRAIDTIRLRERLMHSLFYSLSRDNWIWNQHFAPP